MNSPGNWVDASGIGIRMKYAFKVFFLTFCCFKTGLPLWVSDGRCTTKARTDRTSGLNWSYPVRNGVPIMLLEESSLIGPST